MQETFQIRRDRVSIEAKYHDLYKKLVAGDKALFRTMKDLFLTAACLGYYLNRSEPLIHKQQIFSWTIFSPQDDFPLIHALAVARTGDVKILIDQDKLLTVVEEFANGGIATLEQHLVRASGDPVLNFAQMVISGQPQAMI